MPCTAAIEDRFGPIVTDSCLNGFDFTLLFEETILTFLPLVIASAWATLRVLVLRHEPDKARSSWILPGKLVCYAAYQALQITLLALWAPSSVSKTRFTIACVCFGIASHIIFPVVSYLEHKRSVRPSTMLILYLGITTMLDLARTRTLFFTTQGHMIARVNLASLVIKVLIFGFEMIEKRRILRLESKAASPEAASGTVNRALFIWLNVMFVKGFRTLLTVGTLLPLDDEILAASHPTELMKKWNDGTVSGEDDLLWLFVKHFKWPLLAGVLPRLASAGFTFAQPYLVQRVLDFTAGADGPGRNNTAYALVGAYAIVYVGISLSYAVYQHKTYRLLTLYRGGLVAMLFNKTLRAETLAFDNAEAVTLMSADIDRITGSMHIIHELYASLIETGIALWFLYDFIGVAMVPPLAWMGICLLAGVPLARASGNAQVPWLEAIEDRLAATAKAIGAIKAIRMTGLADYISSLVAESRLAEIRASRRHRVLNIFVFVSSFASLAMAPVWGFLTYILIARASDPQRTLTAGVAFGALSLFELLQQPVQYAVDGMEDYQTLVNSFRRIQEYLVSRDRQDYRIMLHPLSTPLSLGLEERKPVANQSRHAFEVDDATARYTDKGDPVLKNLTFQIPQGQTTIIYGQIGCGKTTLLKLILGEMPIVSGSVNVAHTNSAYCAQRAWCSWGTIQRNIIGMSNWNEVWYRMVLTACSLSTDLAQLPEGDQTYIGNRGSRLSGGQQARISLARAIYSQSPVLLLDAVLEGLDRTTEQHILSAVFGSNGILTRWNPTVVLTTTSADHLRLADHSILLNIDGTLCKQDSQADLGPDNEQHQAQEVPTTQSVPQVPDLKISQENADFTHILDDIDPEDARKTGDFKVYLYYARIAGWPVVTVYLSACAVLVFGLTFPSLWLQWWTNANATNPNERIGYWVGIFAALGVLTLVGCAIADSTFNLILLPKTSRKFHELLLDTTMQYDTFVPFDSQPYGSLTVNSASTDFLTSVDAGTTLNRFSQDLELIDNDLPQAINQTVFQLLSTIVTAALVFSGSGYIAAAIPVLIVLLVLVSLFYLRTSRQMRLLDIEAKAPLFSQFLENMHGIESIRAYGWTAEYSERNTQALHTSQRPYYLLFCLQRWLTLVLDLLNAGVAVVLVAIATNVRNGSTEFLGVALFNIVIFSSTVQSLVTEWTQVEAALGAINRIRAYERSVKNENLPGEDGSLSDDWPKHGAIVFQDVKASYGSPEEPILVDINLRINAGMKVAICGRTGSGKSSLVATILRTMEIDSGTVSIDGVDIASVSREEVRRRLNTVPQEPLSLPGCVRENLDPYESATDERLMQVLQKLHLWKEHFEQHGGLDTDMDEIPLSHGQRQLFCLGRALVKTGNVVILDEATSGIDSETSALMQDVIREEFKGRTIIAVVHKLQEVLDFDLTVVLDRGRIVEVGPPGELLERGDSAFRVLFEANRW